MNALTVKELYTLEETIAKDLFDKVTYPWEVLPNIGSFIKELGNTLSSDEYEKEEKMSGSQSQLKLRLPHVLMVRRSSGKKRKCVIVRL